LPVEPKALLPAHPQQVIDEADDAAAGMVKDTAERLRNV
jgi:cation transport regulator ChaB